MSWARVDDGLWEHDKFEPLREGHEYRAIALWVLALSYCGQKRNPRVTVGEAMMLLSCNEAEAKQSLEVLRSRHLLDDDSASKQGRSYIIHDWEQYRSKDEAKAHAGRQGGIKSGETRRSKTKQTPSRAEANSEANSKQTRSPDPVPDPVPDPDPQQQRTEADTADRIAKLIADWGWSVSLAPRHWPLATRIAELSPKPSVIALAKSRAEQRAKKPDGRTGLFLHILWELLTEPAMEPRDPSRRPKRSDGTLDITDMTDEELRHAQGL